MSDDETRARKAPPGYRDRPDQAKFMGKDEKTIERWDRERTGPPVTYLGQTPIYRIAATDAWLLAQEREQVLPQAPAPCGARKFGGAVIHGLRNDGPRAVASGGAREYVTLTG